MKDANKSLIVTNILNIWVIQDTTHTQFNTYTLKTSAMLKFSNQIKYFIIQLMTQWLFIHFTNNSLTTI